MDFFQVLNVSDDSTTVNKPHSCWSVPAMWNSRLGLNLGYSCMQ